MDFNVFVYLWCCVTGAAAIAIHLLDSRIGVRAQKSYGATFGLKNSEFQVFQRKFFFGYLPCLFADSLQAPYLYYLYHSYGFLEEQIAILYVAGFATSVLFTMVAVYLVQRTERKLLCLIFVGINSVSCLMKFSNLYTVLLFSRVMDGIASSLLSAPFQEWFVRFPILYINKTLTVSIPKPS